MAQLFPLKTLDEFGYDSLHDALETAPEHDNLREAVAELIRALHGIPNALDCELKQLEVYIGRVGFNANLLRARWRARFGEFNNVPSTHAMVVFVGRKARVRNEEWETVAQRIAKALERRKALCCSNIHVGSQGPWSRTQKVAVYMVARIKPGPSSPVPKATIHAAVAELVEEDLDSEIALEASRRILNPDDAHEHEIAETADDEDEDDEDWEDEED